VDLEFGCGFGMAISPHPSLISPLEIMWALDCGCGEGQDVREKKKATFGCAAVLCCCCCCRRNDGYLFIELT
jgi:hypothetical protein